MIKRDEQLAKINHFLDPVLNFRPSAFMKEIKQHLGECFSKGYLSRGFEGCVLICRMSE